MRRFAIALASALLLAGGVEAAEITGLRVALEGDRVLVSFALEGGFNQRLIERVESGLPTTLEYQFELLRDRKRWFDRGIETSRLTVVGIYDAVRREYLVNYKHDGRLVESRMVHDLAALERAMTQFDRLHVFTIKPQASRKRLLVRTRAELGWRHLLGFIPSRITTNWVESPKFRLPPELIQ